MLQRLFLLILLLLKDLILRTLLVKQTAFARSQALNGGECASLWIVLVHGEACCWYVTHWHGLLQSRLLLPKVKQSKLARLNADMAYPRHGQC